MDVGPDKIARTIMRKEAKSPDDLAGLL